METNNLEKIEIKYNMELNRFFFYCIDEDGSERTFSCKDVRIDGDAIERQKTYNDEDEYEEDEFEDEEDEFDKADGDEEE